MPWFAYLAADEGAKVTVYDSQEPAQPDVLEQKGITYIRDTLLNFHNFGSFDLIFCRNLSPPQFLRDWHDPDFLKLWDALYSMSDKIYWIQMGNGTGKPDIGEENPFANHRIEYFRQFFGERAKIRKYGYMAFEIGNVLPEPTGQKQELQGRDLIKWVAYQMQGAGNEVKTPKELHKIIKVLYQNNFRVSKFKIKKGDDITSEGYLHNSYFLVDEHEDNRFSGEFMDVLDRKGYFHW